MDRARFDYLLAAYGADFRRWPEGERQAGAEFAAAHAEVVEAMAEARLLDAGLAAAEDAPVRLELLARVSATASQAPETRRSLFAARYAGWTLAACALVGVVIGYGGGLLTPPATDVDAFVVAAFDGPAAMPDPETQDE